MVKDVKESLSSRLRSRRIAVVATLGLTAAVAWPGSLASPAQADPVIGDITVLSGPIGIAFTPDSTRGFVVMGGPKFLYALETATLTKAFDQILGNLTSPTDVVVSPDGVQAWVALGSGSIQSLNVRSQYGKTLFVGVNPVALAFSPDSTKIWVADSAAASIPIVSARNPAGGTTEACDLFGCAYGRVINSVPVAAASNFLAMSPDGTRLWVAHTEANSISIIDTTQPAVIANVPVKSRPTGIAFSLDGTRAYVAASGSSKLLVFDVAKQAVIETISVGRNPQGITVAPNGETVWVTNQDSNTVSIVDTRRNKVATTISVGPQPVRVAIMPNGSRAWVSNFGASSVSIIDTVQALIPQVTGAKATSGSRSARVTWKAVAKATGVTGYQVMAVPGGKTCATKSTSCTVKGLAPGKRYAFQVRVTTAAGSGAPVTTKPISIG